MRNCPLLCASLALTFLLAAPEGATQQWQPCDEFGGGKAFVALEQGTATANPGDPSNSTGSSNPFGGDPGAGDGPNKFYLNSACMLVGVGPGAGDPPLTFALEDQVDFNTLKNNLMDANILGPAGNPIFKSEDGLQFRPYGTNHCTLKLEVDDREIHPDGTIIDQEWVVPNGSILLRDANCSCSILTPSGAPIEVNSYGDVNDPAGTLQYLERGYRLSLTGSLYRIEPHLAPNAYAVMRGDGTVLLGARTKLLQNGHVLRTYMAPVKVWIDLGGVPFEFEFPLPSAMRYGIYVFLSQPDFLLMPAGTQTMQIPGDCILKLDGTVVDMSGNVIAKPSVPAEEFFWLDLGGTMYRQVHHVSWNELPDNPTLRTNGSIPLSNSVLLKHNGDRWMPGPTIRKANGAVIIWDGTETIGREAIYVPKGLNFY